MYILLMNNDGSKSFDAFSLVKDSLSLAEKAADCEFKYCLAVHYNGGKKIQEVIKNIS